MNKLQTLEQFTRGEIQTRLTKAIALAKKDASYQAEVDALSEALPQSVSFDRLIIKLGATWIPTAYYEQFCLEVLNLGVKVYYSPLVHQWDVRLAVNRYTGRAVNSAENIDWGWFHDYSEDYHKISQFLAVDKEMSKGLFTLALKQQLPSVKVQLYKRGDIDIDRDYTRQAIAKQNQLKRRFEAWCREDPERTEELSRIYNSTMNSTAVGDWKDQGLHLRQTLKATGINQDWLNKLRKYQLDAIWRFTLEGGIVALEVGLGKTAIACAVTMLRRHYRRQKQLKSKALLVVQKSTLNQFYDTFCEIYPQSKVFKLESVDLRDDVRQNTLARIAYLEFDAVIMTHDSFESIPLKKNVEVSQLQNRIRSIDAEMVNLYMEGQTEIAVGSSRGNEVLKSLSREKDRVRDRLKALDLELEPVGITWDELGFNFVLIDEIQKYKNIDVNSLLSKRVAGLAIRASNRAKDFALKIYSVQQAHGFNALVGMTGTPEPTNSLVGVYVFQNYFQPLELEKRGLAHFDAWVANFGEIKSTLEPKIDGTWRLTERLTDFINVAELAGLWFNSVHYLRYEKVVDDFSEADRRPEAEHITIYNQMSAFQTEKMREIGDRYTRLKASDPLIIPRRDEEGYLLDPQGRLLVHPQTKALIKDLDLAINLDLDLDCRIDNFLLLAGESRKLMIAPQLLANVPVEEGSKLRRVAENVLEIYRDTSSERLTQEVFFDIGIPGGSTKFNIYQWLKDFWVENGVAKAEIAFIQDYKNSQQRELLFRAFNAGEIRILIASSESGGVGVNIQERLVAIHHGDLCYRPDQLEQREGRGVRQGNINAKIKIYHYISQGSNGLHGADTVMLQFLQNKQIARDRFFKGDPTLRRLSEGDSGAELYMMLKAESTGDERIIRYTELEVQLEEKSAELSLAQSELARVKGTKVGSIIHTQEAIALLKRQQITFVKDNQRINQLSDGDNLFYFCFPDGELVAAHKDPSQSESWAEKLRSVYRDTTYQESISNASGILLDAHRNIFVTEMSYEEARKYVGKKLVKQILELDFTVSDTSRALEQSIYELGSFRGLNLLVDPRGDGSFTITLEGYQQYYLTFRKTPELFVLQLDFVVEQIALKSDRYWQEKIDEEQLRLENLKLKEQDLTKSIEELEVEVNKIDCQKLELQTVLDIDP